MRKYREVVVTFEVTEYVDINVTNHHDIALDAIEMGLEDLADRSFNSAHVKCTGEILTEDETFDKETSCT